MKLFNVTESLNLDSIYFQQLLKLCFLLLNIIFFIVMDNIQTYFFPLIITVGLFFFFFFLIWSSFCGCPRHDDLIAIHQCSLV